MAEYESNKKAYWPTVYQMVKGFTLVSKYCTVDWYVVLKCGSALVVNKALGWSRQKPGGSLSHKADHLWARAGKQTWPVSLFDIFLATSAISVGKQTHGS